MCVCAVRAPPGNGRLSASRAAPGWSVPKSPEWVVTESSPHSTRPQVRVGFKVPSDEIPKRSTNGFLANTGQFDDTELEIEGQIVAQTRLLNNFAILNTADCDIGEFDRPAGCR